MRSWRKLYSSILESDQCANLSDGAWSLLTILIVAQDDSGFYPWTPTRVRRVTAARPAWSHDVATAHAEELVSSGIAEWVDGGILLGTGKELNGIPRMDVEPEYYPRTGHVNATSTPRQRHVNATSTPRQRHVNATSTSRQRHVNATSTSRQRHVNVTSTPRQRHVNATSTPRNDNVTLEQRREEKREEKRGDKRGDKRGEEKRGVKRGEEKRGGEAANAATTTDGKDLPFDDLTPPDTTNPLGSKRETRITDDFIADMVAEWSPRLGGDEPTRETIASAMNHKAIDKAKDKRLYLKNWLGRQVKWNAERSTNGQPGPAVGEPAKQESWQLRRIRKTQGEQREAGIIPGGDAGSEG